MTISEKKTVLVVDDEEVIREFLTEVLEEDFTVKQACDGDEAIELLKESHFDLIITDLKMPRVPGEEVVKFACENDPSAKVVVISGYSSLSTVSKSVQNGASAFISKPFTIAQLKQAISECMEGAK